MAKRVDFLRLPVKAWQQGDTVAAYRNGRVVRIPIIGESDAPDFPDLAAVATTGKYSDLLNKPTLGTAAAKDSNAFATAAQGTKADTAYGWGNHADAGYVKTNTTYETGSLVQLNAGTDTTGRLQTAKNLNDWLANKGYATTDTTYTASTGLNLTDTSFSVKYGTAAGTAAQGNDSRINNGQAAYSWGNHASAGYAIATALNTKVDKVAGKGLSANDFTNADKGKLDGIAAGATKNATDAQLRARASHTGTQAISTVTGLQSALDSKVASEAGHTLYPAIDKTKLAGVAAGATKNATDAQLRARSSHTGTQPASTVTGLSDAATTSVAAIRSGTTKADVGLSNVRNVDAYSKGQSDSLFELKENLGAAAYAGLGTGASSAARGNHTHVQYWNITSPTNYAPNKDLDTYVAGEGGYSRGTEPNSPGAAHDVITKQQYGMVDLLQIAFPQRTNYNLRMRTHRKGDIWSRWITFWNDANFNPITKADNATQVLAGNGLTGGGAISANRAITLGDPSSITKTATNSVSTTSHSHELGADVKSSLDKADTALQVGDFGLGGTSPAGIPNVGTGESVLDIHTGIGFFRAGSGALDKPTNSTGTGLIRFGWGNGWGTLLYGDPSRNRLFFNNIQSREPKGWAELWHTSNFEPSNYYTKAQADALVAGATSGSNVWQSATTALIKNAYNKVEFPNTKTLTLPSNPTENDYVAIIAASGDMKGSTISRNGRSIMGLNEDMEINIKTPYLRLDYVAGSWRIAS